MPIDGNTWARWKLDSTAAGTFMSLLDSGPSARNASAASVATCPKPTNIKLDVTTGRYARVSDGVDDLMTYTGSAGALASVFQGDCTIEMFLRIDVDGLVGIFSYGASGETLATNYQGSFRVNAAGFLEAFWENGAGVNVTTTQAAGSRIPLGVTTHAAMVKQGTNVLFYIDGVLQDTVAFGLQPTGGTSATLFIGRESATGGCFAGAFKSIRLSNKARSAGEILAAAALTSTTCELDVDPNTTVLYLCNETPDAIEEYRGLHTVRNGGSPVPGLTPLVTIESDGKAMYLNGVTELISGPPPDPNVLALREKMISDVTWTIYFRTSDAYAAGAYASKMGFFLFGDPIPETSQWNYIGFQINDSTLREFEWTSESGAGVDADYHPGELLTSLQAFESHMLVVVKSNAPDGLTYTVTVYLDGVELYSSGALTQFDGGTSGWLRLASGPAEQEWSGILDEIRIDDIARTAAEVAADFAYTAPPPSPPTPAPDPIPLYADAGWATEAWGTDPWATLGHGITVQGAVASATNTVRVTLSHEPAHVDPTADGDALNPATWTVTNLATGQVLTVLQIVPYDLPFVFDVMVLEAFGDHLTQHRIETATLLSAAGSIVTPPMSADFAGVYATTAQDIQTSQRNYSLGDLKNPPAPAGMNSFGGTLQIGADGDYENERGPNLLRKLIVRRLITKPGEFFHLPDYGVGIAVKEPVPSGGDLLALRKEIERQIRLEPDVDNVVVRLMFDDGVLTVRVSARQKSTGLPVDAGLAASADGFVAL